MSFRIFQFVVIHTVKGFSVVHEAEVDVFPGIRLLFLQMLEKLRIWKNKYQQEVYLGLPLLNAVKCQ